MPDSNVSQLVMDAQATTTIIDNLNSIYSSAFGHLIEYTVGLLGLVGVIVPMIYYWFQNKQLKLDKKLLTGKISLEIEDAKKTIIEDIQSKLTIEIEEFEKKVSDIESGLKQDVGIVMHLSHAKIHHLQANSMVSFDKWSDAFEDCLTAIVGYSKASDEANLQTVLKAILIDKVLPNVNKEIIDKIYKLDDRVQEAVDCIDKLNKNGRYKVDLIEFGRLLEAAKVR